jgi:beta-glucosidase
MKRFILLLSCSLFLGVGSISAQSDSEIEQKIDKLVKSMTVEEKVSLCSGGGMGFKGIERLGIRSIACTDGPKGPNAQAGTTAFPCGVMFGSTWNPDVIEKAGEAMGEETRALGRSVLLGPGLNILRDPLGGRFFEYYTEDPFLNAAIAVADVKGLQSQGIAACAKHYACNNREDNRNNYMSVVDDRTLHEIYLPVFKALVQKAKIGTIMTAANGINYEFVSDSRKMLTDILKNKWGFKGFVMTDWLQTRSVEKAAFAGLDVSMPGGDNCGFGSALLKAVKEGRVPVPVIDQKVRAILRVYQMVGALDGKDIKAGAQINTKEHQQAALHVAEDGIVLLKNERNSLPLNPNKIKNILVTGPNADRKFCLWAMGGSSWVQSPYEVTVLDGIKKTLGDKKVTFISSEGLGGYKVIPTDALKPENGKQGFHAQYFVKGNDKPVLERTEQAVNFMWEMKSPDPSIKVDDFREARFDAEVQAPVDGKYTFRFFVSGGTALVYNNEWGGAPIAIADPNQNDGYVTATIDLKKGATYHPCIIYSKNKGDAAIRMEWETPQTTFSQQKMKELGRAARKADAVIYVAGIDYSLDTEGHDKSTIIFPKTQENVINILSKQAKNLSVVMVNGSPLELGGWLQNAKSVVEAWYPGMEGGTAVAKVLFGELNPSGRLPFSWPKKLEDVPCKKLAYEDNDIINFSDSLMVGYRYYDTKNVAPEFPFGYGLSYTSFNYKNLKVSRSSKEVLVTVELKNTGSRDGAEVVQLYVHPVNPTVFRPVHELKGFQKIFLKAGEQKTISFSLGDDAFSYFDVTKNDWKIDRCNYEIELGRNSRDIVLHQPVSLAE